MRKKIIFILAMFVMLIMGMQFSTKSVKAMTITESGKYSLVLYTRASDDDAEIDGKFSKLIRFNFDEGEETIKVSEITKGITPFNGKTEFEGWTKVWDSTKLIEELRVDDFQSSGFTEDGEFENGCTLYAKFSDKELEGKYYISLDGYAGEVNGKSKILLEIDPEEFKTIDLSQYVARREGCLFCGWGFNGKIITSIDKSYFNKTNCITVEALYKSNNFYGVDENGILNNKDLPENQRPYSYVLNLDANGGTLDGESVKSYDYLGGANSGTSMPIYHYIPTRKGCKFRGWNSRKDGKGKNYNYIYWGKWRADDKEKFERDGLVQNGSRYSNLTLYADWEVVEPETTSENITETTTNMSETTSGNVAETTTNTTAQTSENNVESTTAKIDNTTLISENKEDKVVVKKPAIKKIIRGNNSKKVKVIYEKVEGVSGYQIKYSTSKKFTKNTTKTITVKRIKRIVSKTDNVNKSISNTTKQKTTKKKTITKLKANTYYFKVRAYKIVNGKTYYSEWSKVRKTIVKK